MREITAAILGFGFLLATEAYATDPHCVRPEQPPGTGNSMLTWRIPDDCPLTEGERRTKERCRSQPEGARPRGCWGLRFVLKHAGMCVKQPQASAALNLSAGEVLSWTRPDLFS